MLWSRAGNSFFEALGVRWRTEQPGCRVIRVRLLVLRRVQRFGQDEILDGHPRKGGQGLDLTMLLRINFYGKSVHTVKIVSFVNIVNPESPTAVPSVSVQKAVTGYSF